MKATVKWSGVGALMSALGLWLLLVPVHGNAADDKEAGGVPMTDGEYKKLVDQSIKTIQTALKGTPDKKNVAKARIAAVMLAAYAQFAKTDSEGKDRAALRDAALKVAEAIKENKVADARKQADGLAKLKPNADAKADPVDLMKEAGLEPGDVMFQFKTAGEGGGGANAQMKLITNDKKGELPAKVMNDDFVLQAYQIATAMEVIKSYKPDSEPKNWPIFAAEVHKGALDLAALTKKKSAQGAFARVYEITISCNKCHKKYRD